VDPRAPRIKFCGITSLDDAQRAADLGAWAIGLIFHQPSPRRCDPEAAAEITAVLRRRLEIFGVWVNRPLDEVAELAEATGVTGLQLHGDEGPAYCSELARRTGCRVMKAARVRSRADVQALRAFSTDFHLLDSSAPGLPGGTGQTFDWSLVSGRRRPRQLVLSGGLTPGNVAEAIEAVRPWAVDVASGVEAEPGRKDPEKLAAFAAAVNATTESRAA
jgi:phosphoribosylanthranilate isomerase